MNVIRKNFPEEIEELRPLLQAAYSAILDFQSARDDVNERTMRQAIAMTLPVIVPFKEHIPAYKARYIEILEDNADQLTPYDLIVCFDRAIYELHTRLKCGEFADLPWSPELRELFDERRRSTETSPTKANESVKDSPFLTQGNAVTPFVVEGIARIVRAPRDLYRVVSGEILVTEMSDPDFIVVADRIAGLITEQGGLVCHAAILAREWDLPCIVGCRNATTMISDGQYIRMDGATGTVSQVS